MDNPHEKDINVQSGPLSFKVIDSRPKPEEPPIPEKESIEVTKENPLYSYMGLSVRSREATSSDISMQKIGMMHGRKHSFVNQPNFSKIPLKTRPLTKDGTITENNKSQTIQAMFNPDLERTQRTADPHKKPRSRVD